MKLEEVFDIVRRKRLAVVSTVHDSGAPEAALVGFALTERDEVVFDTLGSSRKAVNIVRRPAAALVIGWENDVSDPDRGRRSPAAGRRSGLRQGRVLPGVAGRPRTGELAGYRVYRREAAMVALCELRRRARDRGIRPVARERPPPIAPAPAGVYIPSLNRLRRLVSASELEEHR